jgi:excisionase family DNA binding protein
MSDVTALKARWLDLRAASAYCGLSHKSLVRAVQRGLLPAHRPGGLKRVLVDVEELEKWIRGRRPARAR